MSTKHTEEATATTKTQSRIAEASVTDSIRFFTKVLLPTVACGVIKRRPLVMAISERLKTDEKAVTFLRSLRQRYGPGPLRLHVPGRSILLVLGVPDVKRVLSETPQPFSPASQEKQRALTKFQPHGVLISDQVAREKRRRFNENVLDHGQSLHTLAGPIATHVHEESNHLRTQFTTILDWEYFNATWWRAVRRTVFGKTAADDSEVISLLDSLRRSANWAQFGRRRHQARADFAKRLQTHLEQPEPGSLAHSIAHSPLSSSSAPHDQVAHWLFAFDAAGIATARSLALLSTHPQHMSQAHEELGNVDLSQPSVLPLLQASVLESLRLWPTTPVLLRESTEETTWHGTQVPKGTSFFVFTPLFHRDPERLPYADHFAPEIWLNGPAPEESALVPFSDGPAKCPGRNLVLFFSSSVLAHLVKDHNVTLLSHRSWKETRPLPVSLNPFSLRFLLARSPAE